MKKKLLIVLFMVIMIFLLACEQTESNNRETQDNTTENKGSITFTNIQRAQLEKFYDSDYWVYMLYVEEKSGISRQQIYDEFLGENFNESSYLGSGLIVGTAKEILDLKPVEGFDIVMTEYVNEYYIVDEDYIEKFEAAKDTIYVHLKNIEPSKADFILDNYDVVNISEDYLYVDEKEVYINLNVSKEELESLYNDERVVGMRKRMDIEKSKQLDCINGRIDNYPVEWIYE